MEIYIGNFRSESEERNLRFTQMFNHILNKPVGTQMLVNVRDCPMHYVEMIKRENDIDTDHHQENHLPQKKEYKEARLQGYRWYIEKCIEKNQLGMSTTKKDWFKLYDDVCNKIDEAINSMHGVIKPIH